MEVSALRLYSKRLHGSLYPLAYRSRGPLMYKHARALPKRGFRQGGTTSSSVSNGPSQEQRERLAAYNQRIENERQRSREAAEEQHARGFSNLGRHQDTPSKVWRLMVFDVPSHLGGLLARLSFRATKKNPKHWWRIFDPTLPGAHAGARAVLEQLNEAGLAQRRWSEVDGEMRR